VRPLRGADLDAQAAVVALFHVHVAGFVADGGGESPRLAAQRFQFGVGKDFDVAMQAAFYRGTVGWLVGQHHADATGIGGKSHIQQMHGAAYPWRAIQQMHFVSHFGQQQSRFHPGDARAYHEDGAVSTRSRC